MIVRPRRFSLVALGLSLMAQASSAHAAGPNEAFMRSGWTDLLWAPLYAEVSEYVIVDIGGVLTLVRASPTGARYSLFRSGETVLLVPWSSSPFDVILNFGQTLTCGIGEVLSDPAQHVRFVLPACGE